MWTLSGPDRTEGSWANPACMRVVFNVKMKAGLSEVSVPCESSMKRERGEAPNNPERLHAPEATRECGRPMQMQQKKDMERVQERVKSRCANGLDAPVMQTIAFLR